MFDTTNKGVAPGTSRFQPYPVYKDSGIEWLGEIPEYWRVARADSFFRFEKIQVEPSDVIDELVFHYSIPSIQEIGDGKLERPTEIDSAKLRIIGKRLLVSKLNPRKGVVLIASEKDALTLCSTELVPLEIRNCELKWAFYLISGELTRQRLSAVVRSATRSHQRVEIYDIVKMKHPLPTQEEQLLIADFLDHETAKIDALIEKKERLIELLQEKRTALITQAVTKGLDPTVPMKDSGIEWLGQIPTHWDVLRLKYLSSINDEVLNEKTDPRFELFYVDIGSVDQYQGIVASEELVFETAPSRARRIVRDGDVIISTVRTYLRAIAPIKHPESNLIVSTGFAVIRPSSALESNFAPYALRALHFIESVVANSVGVSYPAIDTPKMSCFLIATPDIEEQQEIAAFLDRETAKIDALMARIQEAIERLKEYRTALISAAVTGKIDVRDLC